MTDYEDLVKDIRYLAKETIYERLLTKTADAIEALVKERDQERAVRQTIEFHSEARWQKVAGANLIAANNALEAENAKLREALENLLFFPNDEGARGHAEETLGKE